jgi:hypothetical protein
LVDVLSLTTIMPKRSTKQVVLRSSSDYHTLG